jgi:hypothetical protein
MEAPPSAPQQNKNYLYPCFCVIGWFNKGEQGIEEKGRKFRKKSKKIEGGGRSRWSPF